MAFPANSSLYAANLLAQFNAPTSTSFDLDTHTFKCQLYITSGTPAGDPFSASVSGYSATGDATGQTGYIATGQTMTGVSSALVGGGTAAVVLRFGAYDTTWPATTNFSNIQGCIIYDDSITGATPVADANLVAINFGTAGSSGGGAFTIGWSGGGTSTVGTIFTIDPNPSA